MKEFPKLIAGAAGRQSYVKVDDPAVFRIVAQTFTGCDTTTEEGHRYARLFAAAPALLQAVKRLLNCPDLCLDCLEEETVQAIEFANELLEKLESEV